MRQLVPPPRVSDEWLEAAIADAESAPMRNIPDAHREVFVWYACALKELRELRAIAARGAGPASQACSCTVDAEYRCGACIAAAQHLKGSEVSR